ncbi:hypothetical protein F4813DRAFT_392277 [Daldinia decipiens]|uniref:uncharacterized protein n=1 Tax=Daldinia decipiens TaxID=326647 RepID=UPI0020C42822|nr:uncharacterized protein F4813DRAFT_392277 [Daldinia decipiens]KAI1654761.1 hypothetical protein F4813DRAFT_392277 [Daldinia decipiens]
MRFTATAVTALLFGANAAMAAEDVSIADFSAHKTGVSGTAAGAVDGVSFKLTGTGAKDLSCSAAANQIASGVPTNVITCGDSKYRFAVTENTDASSFTLQIFHETGTATGFSGSGKIATNCRSGGGNNEVCSQTQSPTTIHIQ